MPLGTHVLADATGCDAGLINDISTVRRAVLAAVKASGATLLQLVEHQFEPYGVTALGVLAESHVSVHTWPERSAYTADMFTCGDCDAEAGMQALVAVLGGSVSLNKLMRGASTHPKKITGG